MASGGLLDVPTIKSKLIGTFSRAIITVNGYYLGKINQSMGSGDFTITTDKDIQQVVAGDSAAGTKATQQVVTGVDMMLAFSLGMDSLSFQTLQLLQGIIDDKSDGETEHGSFKISLFRPLKRYPVKIIAIDEKGVESLSKSDILNFYEVEIDFPEVLRWNASEALEFTVEARIYGKSLTPWEHHYFPEAGSPLGYWGDNVVAGVPKIDWPDRVNPIPVTLDSPKIYSVQRDGKTYKAAAIIETADTLKIRWDKQIKKIGPLAESGLKANKMLTFKVGKRDERSIKEPESINVETSPGDDNIDYITVVKWPEANGVRQEIFQTEYKLGTDPDKAYRVTIPKYFIQDFADNPGETDKDKNNQNYEIENMEVLNILPARPKVISAVFTKVGASKKKGKLTFTIDEVTEQIGGTDIKQFITVSGSGAVPIDEFQRLITGGSDDGKFDPGKKFSVEFTQDASKDFTAADNYKATVKTKLFRLKTSLVSNAEVTLDIDISDFS